MDIGGSIVVLIIAWWIAFQAMLSVGVKSQSEAGGDFIGEPAAPVSPNLLWKGMWSAVIAVIIWAVLFSIIQWSGLSMEDIPSL